MLKLRYSFGLICRVIFCWLSRHSRSLFSVIVSLCSKIDTVCNGKISLMHTQISAKYLLVIDQVLDRYCWILSKFFWVNYAPRQSRGPETHKKRMTPISCHIDRTSLVNNGFIIWRKATLHGTQMWGTQHVIPSEQDDAIIHARVANHSSGFYSPCPCKELPRYQKII